MVGSASEAARRVGAGHHNETKTEKGKPMSRAMFDQEMAAGASRYADVIEALGSAGLPTVFTQTGGMCAALEVTLETGQHLLISDAEDSLSWDRDGQRGWGVGLYRRESEYDDGPVAFLDTGDTSTEALLMLVQQMLLPARG